MFKVEITFKSDLLNVESYCETVDKIFNRYNLPCITKEKNKRVYSDSGDPRDYGRLANCICTVADTDNMVEAISDSYWINDVKGTRENLLEEFFNGD